MNYDIELNANDSSVLETQYAFTQGDYGQIQFSIRVKANGTYITNAQRAYIVFTLPNGYVVTGADMSKSVATYTYPFQGSELQVPGIILADVKLVYTDGQISSNKFSFICRYDPLHDKSFEAGPYISQLQQIVDDGQAKIDYLQSLIEILQTDVGGTPVMRSDLHNTRDAVTAGLKAIDANMAQSILLRGDVTNQYEDDINKLAGAASVYELKDTVDTLISNLTTTANNLNEISGVASTNKPYGGFPINQDSYVTVDKVKNVNLYAQVDANLVQNQYTTVAFVGTEYRPQSSFKTLIGHIVDGTTGAWTTPLSCFVYSTGEIKVYTSLASGAYKVAVVGCYSKY